MDTATPPRSAPLRIAYLVSEHPALSHTFIDREIAALEGRGHEVLVASIRHPKDPSRLGPGAAERMDRIFYVLRAGKSLPGACARLARRRPKWSCLLSTWLRAVRRQPLRPASYAYLPEAILVLDWMRREGITHLHNHFGNAAGTVAAIAAASGLVKYSISLHGPDVFYNVDAELLREKLEWADFVRCISWYSKSQACLLTSPEQWGKFSIVRCGVDVGRYAARPEPGNAVPRVLCVGRLVPAKGQRMLLDASERLMAAGVNHELVFAGTGPDEERLRDHAARAGMNHARFLGGLDSGAVLEEYRRADVFVLPSFAEGVPVVLMEAMACGVPVISTRITGIPELIEDGTDGLLVPAGDSDALASALARLLADADLRARLGHAGRLKVSEHYDLGRNGAAMADLFERNLPRAA
jgi:glycosyltransferase involved in cell wall biosynthesis